MPPPAGHDRHLRRFRALAYLLDSAVRIPGTRQGVGLDFVLGLVPGIGDLAGGVLSAYGLWVAVQVGAPRSVLLRMAGNIAVDTVVGTVPVLGDLFDLGFRANLRNLALLERWLESPGRTQRASRALVVAVALGLAVLALGLAAALAWALAAGAGLVHAALGGR